MISRSKAALIFSIALLFVAPHAGASVVRSVSVAGNRAVSSSEIARNSLIRPGDAFSDSLLLLEVTRIDSLYFSMGVIDLRVAVDTVRSGENVDLLLGIEEGERARVGRVSVSGSTMMTEEEIRRVFKPAEGDPFDPFLLERSLAGLLERYNDSGYPYAQIWLTGFAYREDANEVDLVVSISEAERSSLARIVFEGLSKTDSTVALRTSRLRPGEAYRSASVERARAYLSSSGYFESVGEARLERRRGGAVDLFIPVKEAKGAGAFQGAVGFSRKADGSYVASGAAALALRNIGGKGRGAAVDWLNDGEQYSRIALRFQEPFLFSSRFGLGIDVSQIVQDSVYVFSAGALTFNIPVGPATTIHIGVAGDRNIPEFGELERSVRQRYRLGVSRVRGRSVEAAAHVEGAYRKRYLTGGRSARDGEILYGLDVSGSIPTFAGQSVFLRLASEGLFSTEEVPLAETYPLGGANSLRGYREAQFRGQKIAWTNIEYRFGEGGLIFLFDDVGAYQSPEGAWAVHNGAGFGLRAQSPIGVVSLSFGVGRRLALDEMRMHVSLSQRF